MNNSTLEVKEIGVLVTKYVLRDCIKERDTPCTKGKLRSVYITMWQSTDVIVFNAGLADSIRLLF